MTKLFLILISLIQAQDFNPNIREMNNYQEVPNVNISFEKTKNHSQTNQNTSQKGFCSVDEAVEKLFFLSNTNWGGNTGLIQSYKAKLKNDCYPEKYYYPTISASGIYTVCYKLPQKCGGPQGKPYDPNHCSLSTDGLKLKTIKDKLILERDKFIEKSAKEIEIKIKRIATKRIEEKLTEQLAKNPNQQLRLAIEDIYAIRSEIAKELSKDYGEYIVNVVINEIGEFIFSNFEYFSPIISLSGTPGYILLGALPFADELIQCNISIKNLILKGAIKAGTKLVFKVPVVKNLEQTYQNSFTYEFLKSATISEASKWIKHYFGDGLEVKMVNPVKEYGKDFALITVEVVLKQHSNRN